MTAMLPKIFRWVFTVLAVLAGLAALSIVLALLIDPRLPPGTHFGPTNVELLGQPGTVALRAVNGDFDFTVTALRGNLTLFVEKAGGLIEVIKHHGLPVLLLDAIFFAALFELLRRLFRNVGRGESFTPQSVRLVQYVGGTLIVFSIVSAFAESWFVHAAYAYLAAHAVATISGTSLRLPAPDGMTLPHGGGSPVFFGPSGAGACGGFPPGPRAQERKRSDGVSKAMPIKLNLDRVMLERQVNLTELAERIGITLANLSILKTNKARAIRFSTLDALCRALRCQPGELLEFVQGTESAPAEKAEV